MSASSIQLNGNPHRLEEPTTVAELLQSLGLERKPVVVELNGQALSPPEHQTAQVTPGARVELITLAAGG